MLVGSGSTKVHQQTSAHQQHCLDAQPVKGGGGGVVALPTLPHHVVVATQGGVGVTGGHPQPPPLTRAAGGGHLSGQGTNMPGKFKEGFPTFH